MAENVLRASVLPEFIDLYGDKYRYLVYYSGRSTGKSFAVADWQITIGMSKRLKFLDCREYLSSIRESVKSLLESRIHDRNLDEYFKIGRDTIECTLTGSTWSFIGMHNNTQTVKSFDGVDVCWVEESQVVTYDSLMTLLPTIRKAGSRVVFTMNRLTDSDAVYQYFTETPPPRSMVKYLDPLTLDRYGLQPQEIIDLREAEKGSRDYAYVWLGEPLAQIDNAILSRDVLVKAFERQALPETQGAWEVGVDVARFGADRTVFVARKGLSAQKIAVYTKEPLTRQAELLKAFCDGMENPRIKMDSTGVGGGLVDICQQQGMNVVDVNFAQQAKEPDKYPNAASEQWFNFANIVSEVSLSGVAEYRQELLSELSQRSWSFDGKGRRIVEQKSAFKASGNRSPDLADALLLAFYEPKEKHVIEWW